MIAILKRTNRSASVQGGSLVLDGDLLGVPGELSGLELFAGDGSMSDEGGVILGWIPLRRPDFGVKTFGMMKEDVG